MNVTLTAIPEVLIIEPKVTKRQMWKPPGFAHGFFVTSEWTGFCYKITNCYAPEFEPCIAWNDPQLAIPWPFIKSPPIHSGKDLTGLMLHQPEREPQHTPPQLTHVS